MYKVIVCKNFGPFEFECATYEEAVALLKEKWFGCGVWDVRLFHDGKEVEIGALVRSWGNRPTYC